MRDNEGFSIVTNGASDTVPTYRFGGDADTGMGRAGDDQLYLMAGGVEGLRITETAASIQILLPQDNDPVTPTLAFGDGDSGFYEMNDDEIVVAIAGVQNFKINATVLYSMLDNEGFSIVTNGASSTAPTYRFSGDADTGMGRAGDDQLYLMAGGVEGLRIVEDTTVATWLLGGVRKKTEIFTSDRTVILSDQTIRLDGTSNTVTATLPSAASAYDATTKTGAIFTFKCINNDNQVDYVGNGAELVDGANQHILAQYDSHQVQSNGTSWDII